MRRTYILTFVILLLLLVPSPPSFAAQQGGPEIPGLPGNPGWSANSEFVTITVTITDTEASPPIIVDHGHGGAGLLWLTLGVSSILLGCAVLGYLYYNPHAYRKVAHLAALFFGAGWASVHIRFNRQELDSFPKRISLLASLVGLPQGALVAIFV